MWSMLVSGRKEKKTSFFQNAQGNQNGNTKIIISIQNIPEFKHVHTIDTIPSVAFLSMLPNNV